MTTLRSDNNQAPQLNTSCAISHFTDTDCLNNSTSNFQVLEAQLSANCAQFQCIEDLLLVLITNKLQHIFFLHLMMRMLIAEVIVLQQQPCLGQPLLVFPLLVEKYDLTEEIYALSPLKPRSNELGRTVPLSYHAFWMSC